MMMMRTRWSWRHVSRGGWVMPNLHSYTINTLHEKGYEYDDDDDDDCDNSYENNDKNDFKDIDATP